MSIEIRLAYRDMDLVRELFREYAKSLNFDMCFEGFTEELNQLPGDYAKPRGALYIAFCDDQPAGCVAMRPLDETRCEMKRLFVRPQYRKMGIGKMLSQHLMRDAAELKYTMLCLETLNSMESAVRLYKTLGFCEIEPYCGHPFHDTLYLGIDLPDKPE